VLVPAPGELEIAVEMDEPQGASTAGAAGTGGVVLPPLKGAEAQTAVAGSIAAAGSLVAAPPKIDLAKPKVADSKHGPNAASPPTDAKAQLDASGSGEKAAGSGGEDVGASDDVRACPATPESRESPLGSSRLSHDSPAREKPDLEPKRDSYLPPRARKGSRFAGIVLATGVVGVIGVLGGVAGAVYVMKGSGNTSSPTPSLVALQPQSATPASAASSAPEPVTETAAVSARSKGAQAAAADTESAGVSARHSVDSHRGSAVKPSAAAAARVPVAKAPAPVTNAQPVVAATTPFNRDSALAVLGFAASRAPTCKKPDSPKGSARVQVTFDPSGAVVAASVVGAPIAGTPTAQCVASIFRKVRVAPFAGDRVTIPKDFTIPP